jgi:hypothetical protein
MTDNFIQISRPNIVSFYTKYSNNISTIASIEDIFESICKQFDSILSNTQLENNNHYLQSFLQSLDKKYDKLELSFKQNSETIATTISDNLSKDISQQFYTVFKNIESCVANLNIDNIISSIDKIITSSSKSTLDDLDKNIKQNIILPVHDNHHKLIEQLHKLVEHNNDSTTIDSKISSISDTWNHKIDNLLLHIKRLDDTVEQTTSSTTIKTVLSELLKDIEKQHISLNTTITLIRI